MLGTRYQVPRTQNIKGSKEHKWNIKGTYIKHKGTYMEHAWNIKEHTWNIKEQKWDTNTAEIYHWHIDGTQISSKYTLYLENEPPTS